MSTDSTRHLRATVRRGSALREALERLQVTSTALLLVVDDAQRLVGSLSDGDVRRAFLAGASLDDPVEDWARVGPVSVPAGTDRAAVLDLMRARDLPQIPEVDEDGRVVRLHLLKEILGGAPLGSPAVILAGGRGTRLRTVTDGLPKPMVAVAGRPILERLVLHLVGSGVRHVALAVGYRAEVIEEHFGDGSHFGCSIRYLHEDRPRGTAGPLRAVPDLGAPWSEGDSPLLVMNGDLITSFSVSGLLRAHVDAGARLTVALTDYAHEVPYGVLSTDSEMRVIDVEEKPTWRGSVSAGIYAIDRRVLDSIPPDEEVPMTDVIRGCLERGETVHAWQVAGEWHDVGRPQDLAVARGL